MSEKLYKHLVKDADLQEQVEKCDLKSTKIQNQSVIALYKFGQGRQPLLEKSENI